MPHILISLPYFVAAWLFFCGLYGVVTSRHLVHAVISLADIAKLHVYPAAGHRLSRRRSRSYLRGHPRRHSYCRSRGAGTYVDRCCGGSGGGCASAGHGGQSPRKIGQRFSFGSPHLTRITDDPYLSIAASTGRAASAGSSIACSFAQVAEPGRR